ncbi:hypothetical protein [Streptomyces sp. E-08]|uniref:hypothetical protein n=1 Tax=Streptomyces sp. E-08 TaxID=3404047 RepID=UPI003CED5242
MDALCDPTKALDGGTRNRPVQIQHFACHGDTTDKTDPDFALLLGGPYGRGRRISLRAIRHGFRQRQQRLGSPSGARALIVANACGSAVIDRASHRSFRLFTDRGIPLGLLYVLYGDPFLGIG